MANATFLSTLMQYDRTHYTQVKDSTLKTMIPLGQLELYLCGSLAIMKDWYREVIGVEMPDVPGICWMGGNLTDVSILRGKIFILCGQLENGKYLPHQHALGHELWHWIDKWVQITGEFDGQNPDRMYNE